MTPLLNGGYRQTQFEGPSRNVLRRIDKLTSRNVPGMFFDALDKLTSRNVPGMFFSKSQGQIWSLRENVLRLKAQVRRLFSRNVLQTFKTNSVQCDTPLRLFFLSVPIFLPDRTCDSIPWLFISSDIFKACISRRGGLRDRRVAR